MGEVEQESSRKLRASFVVTLALVGTLAISSLWLFMRADSLQMQVGNLQTENNSFQSSIVSLQTEMHNLTRVKSSLQDKVDDLTKNNTDLKSEVGSLTTENDNLQSEIFNLESEINDLQREIDWLRQIAEEDNFQFYYVKPEEQKFGVYNLEDELDGLEWTEPYQEGVFDCSEMSACLEWFLENGGWHVKIYVGDSPFSSGKHAWLIVETSEGKYMPVESTTLHVVWWSDPNFDDYWEYEDRFETIQDAIAYSESGFDWWELGFSPLEH